MPALSEIHAKFGRFLACVALRRALLLLSIAMPLYGSTGKAEGVALGGDFILADAAGGSFRLAAYRGRVVLVYFGYTGCPDLCPTQLSTMRAVLERLGGLRNQVTPVFISVDPARDAPPVLREYVRNFDPAIVALTGSKGELRRVARAYGADFRYATGNGRSYTVDHSTQLFVVDRRGRLVRVLPHGTPVEEIVRVVKELIGR